MFAPMLPRLPGLRLLALVLVAGLIAPTAATAAKAKKAEPVVVAPPPSPPDPEAWRATPPAPGPEPTWQAPEVKSFTLQNGVPVYLVRNDGLPLVSVRLLLKVGREANPVGKEGLGALVVEMMKEGSKDRTGAEIAAEAAMLGATVNLTAGPESVTVALDALSATLGESLDLVADQVRNPRFSKKDFGRVQANVLASIDAAGSDARDLATRAAGRALFGADHPYGAAVSGTQASVGDLSIKDVKKFYKAWWGPQNLAIVVTGAIDEATAKSALDARFGDWEAGKGGKPPAVPAPAVPLKTRVVFVELPNAEQSMLRVVTPAMARSNPDFVAAYVEGTLVGGMFSSRLNMNLREEHGWSYGAYGGFIEARDHGAFGVRTSVQADKTAPAIGEILKELTAASTTAPTAADLQVAKDNILKSIPGDFEANADIARVVTSIPTYGLPADLLRTWPSQVAAVDSAAAFGMAKKFFGSDRMIIVVVGPRTVAVNGTTTDVVAELKALGFEYSELKIEELK